MSKRKSLAPLQKESVVEEPKEEEPKDPKEDPNEEKDLEKVAKERIIQRKIDDIKFRDKIDDVKYTKIEEKKEEKKTSSDWWIGYMSGMIAASLMTPSKETREPKKDDWLSNLSTRGRIKFWVGLYSICVFIIIAITVSLYFTKDKEYKMFSSDNSPFDRDGQLVPDKVMDDLIISSCSLAIPCVIFGFVASFYDVNIEFRSS